MGIEGCIGVIVSFIVVGGLADEGGFECEDVIFEVEGNEVESFCDLICQIGDIVVGECVCFIIWCDGCEQILCVCFGDCLSENDFNEMLSMEEEVVEVFCYFGMSLILLIDEVCEVWGILVGIDGLVVEDVEIGSEVVEKGFLCGDVILEVGGQVFSGIDILVVVIVEVY